MGKTANRGLRARQATREHRLKELADRRDGRLKESVPTAPAARTRPETVACAWCKALVAVKPRGRVPLWCSTSCRHRAWEQNRAAASGRSAVTVVERVVAMPARPATRTPIGQPRTPRQEEWDGTLRELVRQLDTGRLYDKHVKPVATAVVELNAALNRRMTTSNRW